MKKKRSKNFIVLVVFDSNRARYELGFDFLTLRNHVMVPIINIINNGIIRSNNNMRALMSKKVPTQMSMFKPLDKEVFDIFDKGISPFIGWRSVGCA